MKKYLEKFKQNCISGILFLLPVLILFILIKKVFAYFAKFGDGIAKIMGFKEMFGLHAADFLGAMILFLFIFFCGLLVRLAFFKKISDTIDAKLKLIIPGYEKQKENAKKQLIKKGEKETDLPVLIQFGDYWRPGFLVEQNEQGSAVVEISNAESSEIFIIPMERVKILKETKLSTLKEVIKSSGKGLLACQ